MDRSFVFGGDLIVVTGNGEPGAGGNVWRVTAAGVAIKIATITDPVTGAPVHLEGVITLPNDPRYGPWAGTIIAGDENFNTDLTKWDGTGAFQRATQQIARWQRLTNWRSRPAVSFILLSQRTSISSILALISLV